MDTKVCFCYDCQAVLDTDGTDEEKCACPNCGMMNESDEWIEGLFSKSDAKQMRGNA